MHYPWNRSGNGLLVSMLVGVLVLSLSAEALAEKGLVRMGVPHAVGLVLDRRGNLYAADRKSGDVFCLPPTSSPVLLSSVPGKPTCLAVSRGRAVYVGTEAGVVYGVSLDGTVWEACRLDAAVTGVAVDRDGGLLILTNRGMVVYVPDTASRR